MARRMMGLRAIAVCVCVGMGLSGGGAAVAAEPAVGTGDGTAAPAINGDLGGGGPDPDWALTPDSQQAKDKLALADAWMRAVKKAKDKIKQNGSTVSALSATSTNNIFAEYNSLVANYEATYGAEAPLGPVAGTSSGGGIVPMVAGPPTYIPPPSYTLPVVHSPQTKTYYCGPATGYMILKLKGRTSASGTGASLSQAALGGTSYMKTDVNKSTSEGAVGGKYYMAVGLNKWSYGTESGYYVPTSITSKSQLSTMFLYSIFAYEPFAVSTIEYAGTGNPHYNAHPARLIGHWVVGIGYTSSGAGLVVDDPVADAPALAGLGYDDAEARYFPTASSFLTFVQGRRSVW